MSEYNGYKVGDILNYTDEDDPALGVILKIDNRHQKITIDWIWAENNSVGVDELYFDDMDAFEPNLTVITEQEKLIFLLKI